MYQSKYYTCEEIDERLLKSYYDDAVSKGYPGTFDQFKLELASQDTVNMDILNNNAGYTSDEVVTKIAELYPPAPDRPITFIFFDKTYNRERRFKYKGQGPASDKKYYLDVSNYLFTLAELNGEEGAAPINELLHEIILMGFYGRAMVIDSIGKFNFYCGILFMFGDNMGHVINQVLVTNNFLSEDGTTILPGHNHTRTFQYERFLVYSGSWKDREDKDVSAGTYSKWYPSDYELKKEVYPIELTNYTSGGKELPRAFGSFTIDGYLAHYRSINHGDKVYLVFCGQHQGTSGIIGHKYIIFIEDSNQPGTYVFSNQATSTNAPEWVKRAFCEATATDTYTGLMSSDMFTKVRNTVPDACVTCNTSASTAAKTISLKGFTSLPAQGGGSIKVKFLYINTAENPTLNISGTGAKPLYFGNKLASASNTWEAASIVEVFYDGTNYRAESFQKDIKDINTTLSLKTEKVRIDIVPNGSSYQFKKGLEILIFSQLVNMLQVSHDLIEFVYDNRYYQCVQLDLFSTPKQILLVSPRFDKGITTHGFNVTSNDGVAISTVNSRYFKGEDLGNKVTEVEANKTSNDKYPSAKAVYDHVKPVKDLAGQNEELLGELESDVAENAKKISELDQNINGHDNSSFYVFSVNQNVADYDTKRAFILKRGKYKVVFNTDVVSNLSVLSLYNSAGSKIYSKNLLTTEIDLAEDSTTISIWYNASMTYQTGELRLDFIDAEKEGGFEGKISSVKDDIKSIKGYLSSRDNSCELTLHLKGNTSELQTNTKVEVSIPIGKYYVDCEDIDKITSDGLVRVYAFYKDGTEVLIGDLSSIKKDYWHIDPNTNILQFLEVEKEISAIGVYHSALSIPKDCDFTIKFVDSERTKSFEEKIDLLMKDQFKGYQNSMNIQQGEAVTTPLVHVVKNTMLNAEILGEIQDACVGYGYGSGTSKRGYNSQWLRILPTKVEMWVNVGSNGSADNGYEGSSNQKKIEWEHGLLLDGKTIVSISRNDKITITITTGKGDSFTLPSTVSWNGVGQPFVENNGASPLNASLSFMLGDLSKEIWIIGDSYCGLFNDARWPTQLTKKGYTNFLMNAVGGENAKEAYYDLLNLLSCGHSPKYILWAEGMNGETDSSETSASWYQKLWLMRVLRVMKEHEITPILMTIPSVKTLKHHAWSQYVRELGYRYVDVAEAVGSNYDGTWTEGLLSSDGLHPSEAGAKIICERVLRDFPEIAIE